MARYAKKSRLGALVDESQQRLQRKLRGTKLAAGSNKYERRHGWGYAKRRALLDNL